MKQRAIYIREHGGPEVLELRALDLPAPVGTQVLVRVAGSGLNRADILQRRGLYPAPRGVPHDIPGLEFAGTVECVGRDVVSVQPGERVMGIVAGGAMATHVLTEERMLAAVPPHMSLLDASAIPEAFMTAYDALFMRASVGVGTRVLVHAASSGVGTAALQLAKTAGALVLGTSRSKEKLERCARLGLDHAIAPTEDGGFAQPVLDVTQGKGVDLVLDLVGGRYLEQNLRCIAVGGTILTLGLLGGASAQLPLARLLAQRARIEGTVLRGRPRDEKAALTRAFADRVVPLFARSLVTPVIDSVMAPTAIRQAHERMERNETFGKVIIQWDVKAG